MRVGNEHGINLLMPGLIYRRRVAAQMPDPWTQDGVGEQANTIDFDERGCVADVGKVQSGIVIRHSIRLFLNMLGIGLFPRR